jgi:hypothetical protein
VNLRSQDHCTARAIGFDLQKSLPNSDLGEIAFREFALTGPISGFSRPEFETSLSSVAAAA